MEIAILILTILCILLAAQVVVDRSSRKGQPRVTSTAEVSSPTPTASAGLPTASTTIPATHSAATATATKPVVVRVSNIRTDDFSSANEVVRTAIKGKLSADEENAISCVDIVPSCTDPDTLVAIVDFRALPRFLKCLKNGSQDSYQLPASQCYNLILSLSFLDFTQMYDTDGEPDKE